MEFKLKAPFEPMGDQPQAITELVEGLNDAIADQVLLVLRGPVKPLR